MSLSVRGLAPTRSDPDSFLTMLDPATPDRFGAMALTACGDRAKCKVMGWTDPDAVPFSLPLTSTQVAALSFSYLRDRSAGFEKMLWNCAEFPSTPPAQCMKRQVPGADRRRHGNADAPPIEQLEGVRRKEQTPSARTADDRAARATAPVPTGTATPTR